MNRQLFLQLLEHPDSVSEQESIALQKFTEDFPYCQTGRLLFVKHLHSQQSVHYPEQLKIAAAYAADRKVLYNLIHSPAKKVEVEVDIVEEQNPQPEPLSLKEERTEETLSLPLVEVIPEKKIIEASNAQTEIIQKRLQEISASPPTPLQRRGKPVPTKNIEESVISESEIITLKEASITPPKEIIPETIFQDKKEDPKSGKHSFTEWLKTVKKEPAAKPAGQEKSTPPVSSTDEIINRFIETEPRIIPSKAEFYNPVKMAKQSLEEHDDLISETLAGIFAEQGNLPRAIEMYRKLMLSNPEKSSFFAALIEKLTQQLKEDK